MIQDMPMDTKGLYDDIQQITRIPIKISKKSPRFVPLKDSGKRATDRLMNGRFLRPPKNIELIEGDGKDGEDMEKDIVDFINIHDEDKLISKIRMVNQMGYSNQSVEQKRRSKNSQSVSPKGRKRTITRSTHRSPENSIITCNKKCDNIRIHDVNSNNIETPKKVNLDKETEKMISNCRYAKNALLIGLLKQNFISLQDLDVSILDVEGGNACSTNQQPIPSDIKNKSKINSSETLLRHSDDSKKITNPLQKYKQVGKHGNDATMKCPCKMENDASRQYSFSTSLNDSFFEFKRKKPQTSEPKHENNETISKSCCTSKPVQAQARNPYSVKTDQCVPKGN